MKMKMKNKPYVGQTIEDINMEENINYWSWKRPEFLVVFSHPEEGDPRSSLPMLYNDSYWTVIPNKCFETILLFFLHY